MTSRSRSGSRPEPSSRRQSWSSADRKSAGRTHVSETGSSSSKFGRLGDFFRRRSRSWSDEESGEEGRRSRDTYQGPSGSPPTETRDFGQAPPIAWSTPTAASKLTLPKGSFSLEIVSNELNQAQMEALAQKLGRENPEAEQIRKDRSCLTITDSRGMSGGRVKSQKKRKRGGSGGEEQYRSSQQSQTPTERWVQNQNTQQRETQYTTGDPTYYAQSQQQPFTNTQPTQQTYNPTHQMPQPQTTTATTHQTAPTAVSTQPRHLLPQQAAASSAINYAPQSTQPPQPNVQANASTPASAIPAMTPELAELMARTYANMVASGQLPSTAPTQTTPSLTANPTTAYSYPTQISAPFPSVQPGIAV